MNGFSKPEQTFSDCLGSEPGFSTGERKTTGNLEFKKLLFKDNAPFPVPCRAHVCHTSC